MKSQLHARPQSSRCVRPLVTLPIFRLVASCRKGLGTVAHKMKNESPATSQMAGPSTGRTVTCLPCWGAGTRRWSGCGM